MIPELHRCTAILLCIHLKGCFSSSGWGWGPEGYLSCLQCHFTVPFNSATPLFGSLHPSETVDPSWICLFCYSYCTSLQIYHFAPQRIRKGGELFLGPEGRKEARKGGGEWMLDMGSGVTNVTAEEKIVDEYNWFWRLAQGETWTHPGWSHHCGGSDRAGVENICVYFLRTVWLALIQHKEMTDHTPITSTMNKFTYWWNFTTCLNCR